jgi:hypothetical protein
MDEILSDMNRGSEYISLASFARAKAGLGSAGKALAVRRFFGAAS